MKGVILLGMFGWGVPPEFPYPGPISDCYMPGLSDLEQGGGDASHNLSPRVTSDGKHVLLSVANLYYAPRFVEKEKTERRKCMKNRHFRPK